MIYRVLLKNNINEGVFILKIAIATEQNNVFGHFGKCENFTVVEIENSEVKSKTILTLKEINMELSRHFLPHMV